MVLKRKKVILVESFMYRIFKKVCGFMDFFAEAPFSAKEKMRITCGYLAFVVRGKLGMLSLGEGARGIRLGKMYINAPTFENLRLIVWEIFFQNIYRFKSDSPKPVIFDCGGNVGVASLYFKYLRPEAVITTFEPSEMNSAYLEKNVANNKLSDVRVVRAALSNHEGTATFWENKKKPGGSTATPAAFAASQHAENFVRGDVPTVRLSNYVQSNIDLVKIDVEGAEGVIIRDLKDSGKIKYIQEFIFEYSHYPKNEESNRLSDIIAILEDDFYVFCYDAESPMSGKLQVGSTGAYHFMVRAVRKESIKL